LVADQRAAKGGSDGGRKKGEDRQPHSISGCICLGKAGWQSGTPRGIADWQNVDIRLTVAYGKRKIDSMGRETA
jgi:hypothetical protein